MQSGALCRQDDPAGPDEFLGEVRDAAQHDAAFHEVEAPPQGVAHRGRLLEDFLLHVVRVGAHLDLFEIDLELLHLRVHRDIVQVRGAEPVACDLHDIVIIERDGLSRMGDDRRGIRADDEFAVAHANDQG